MSWHENLANHLQNGAIFRFQACEKVRDARKRTTQRGNDGRLEKHVSSCSLLLRALLTLTFCSPEKHEKRLPVL